MTVALDSVVHLWVVSSNDFVVRRFKYAAEEPVWWNDF
jgi:hypothetical protein